MLMFDAHNTPAFDPVVVGASEGCALLTSMLADGTPVLTRSWARSFSRESVTVFWTLTPRGEVGTVFEHTRYNAYNVPMSGQDREVEDLRQHLVNAAYAQYDRDTEYAVGE